MFPSMIAKQKERDVSMSTDIKKMYERAKAAFKEVEFWPQDKVDEMVAAVGWAW